MAGSLYEMLVLENMRLRSEVRSSEAKHRKAQEERDAWKRAHGEASGPGPVSLAAELAREKGEYVVLKWRLDRANAQRDEARAELANTKETLAWVRQDREGLRDWIERIQKERDVYLEPLEQMVKLLRTERDMLEKENETLEKRLGEM